MSDTVVCTYCGVDDATVLFGPGVAQASQIVKCNHCGLMYANPRSRPPDHVEIASWESDPEHNPWTEDNPHTAFRQVYLKERDQVGDYDATRELLNTLYPKRGKLIEIGSSLGFLLKRFRDDGWDVLGIEPSALSADYAKTELGLDVIRAIPEDANVAPECCDVVIMNHVIEHVDDPMRTLKLVHRMLKPGGHFVMETPRYDSLMFKLLGRRERSLSYDGHLYFFTTETLRKLYEKAGFRSLRTDYVGRTLTADRLLWNLGVISKNQKLQQGLMRLSDTLHLAKLQLYINLRDMQRVCIQKV